MESFERGQHVIVTEHDDKIAGHLMEILDEGYVVIVTHRMLPVPKVIPDEVRHVIRNVVTAMPVWRLKVTAALQSVRGWRVMDLESLRDAVCVLIERETLSEMPDEAKLTEIVMPVTTFINGGEVKRIESTVESNGEFLAAVAIAKFRDGMDAEIEQLMTEADEAKANAEKEKNGEDVHTESGSDDSSGSN
jgi:hypothetical protein